MHCWDSSESIHSVGTVPNMPVPPPSRATYPAAVAGAFGIGPEAQAQAHFAGVRARRRLPRGLPLPAGRVHARRLQVRGGRPVLQPRHQ